MDLWLQEVKLIAGTKEFESKDFDIEFNVPFSTSKDPDVSEVIIYNLTDKTIESIASKAFVILNAGYKGDVGNILSGKIESIKTTWEGLDKATRIKVSDGGLEWRGAKVNKTYAPGSTAKYIMNDLAGLLGLEVVEVEPKKDITYQLGRTINGYVETALKGLAQDTESKMYINKGKLYIRDEGKGTKTGFLLNADTGLIESPQKIESEDKKKKKIIKYNVKCLLNHKINTDSIIKIESKVVNGMFRVESGKHTRDFTTECIVVPM